MRSFFVFLVVAVAVAAYVDVVIGAEHPGRVPLLVSIGAFALVFLAKGLGMVVQRPIGSRPGEVGDEGSGDA